MKSASFARLTSLCVLACAWSLAHAGNGIVTDALGTYEEVRFYTPGTADIPLRSGTPDLGPNLCQNGAGPAEVCAQGLVFGTQTAGQLLTYGYDDVAPVSLVAQSLGTSQHGLGVITQNTAGQLSTDQPVDSGQYLNLAFEKATTILGFVLFDVHGQTLGTNTRVHLIVDEMDYTLTGANGLSTPITGQTFTLVGGSDAYYLGAVRLAAAVPEPSTWALMGVGLLGLAFQSRRRR